MIVRVKDKKGNVIELPAIKGDSAYQIAVRNGFNGTEKEWLESINDNSKRMVDGVLILQTDVECDFLINNSKDAYIVGLNMYGYSEIEGVPHPTTPLEIQSICDPIITLHRGDDSQSVTIPLTLRGIANANGEWECQDEIVVSDGKVTHIQRCGVKVLDGSETITQGGTYKNEFIFTLDNCKTSMEHGDPNGLASVPALCTHYAWHHTCNNIASQSYKFVVGTIRQLSGGGKTNNLIIMDSAVNEDVATLRSYIKSQYEGNSPVTFIYQLATPIETDITISEIGQALLKLRTYYPVTFVTCDTDCKLSYGADVGVEYAKLLDRIIALEEAAK